MTRALTLASVCFVSITTGVQAEVLLSKDATGHVTVPTFVNGKGPFPFILDTGADESAVYSWFAKSLRLAKGANRVISGATGSAQTAGTRLVSLNCRLCDRTRAGVRSGRAACRTGRTA